MAWNRVVVCTVVLVVGAVHALGAANALPVAGVGATRPSSDTAAAAPRARPAAGDVGDSAGDSARGVGGVHGMFPAAELGGHRSRELRRARSPRDDTAPVKLGALPSWLAAAPFLPSVDTPARPVPEPSSSLADAAGGRSGVGSDEGAAATGSRGNDERQAPALSWVLDGRPAAGATRLYPHASLVVATGVKAAHEIRHVLCLVRSLREHHPDADDVPVVVWDLMTPGGYLDPHDHDRYQRGHLRGGGTPGRGAHHKRPAPSPVGTVSHLQFVRDRLRARVAQLPGVEYRRFPFERLPPHFTTDGSSGGFHAWQPLVLMEHLLEGRAHGTNRAPVLWAGPYTRVLHSLMEAEDSLHEHGLLTRRSPKARMSGHLLPPGMMRLMRKAEPGSVFNPDNNHPLNARTYARLPALTVDPLGVDNRDDLLRKVIAPWVACALLPECMAPEGSTNRKFPYRNTQAALSTLVYWHVPEFYPRTGANEWLDTAVREAFASRRDVLAPRVKGHVVDNKCQEPEVAGDAARDRPFQDAYTHVAGGTTATASVSELPVWMQAPATEQLKPPAALRYRGHPDEDGNTPVVALTMTGAASAHALSALCTLASFRELHPDSHAYPAVFWDLGVVGTAAGGKARRLRPSWNGTLTGAARGRGLQARTADAQARVDRERLLEYVQEELAKIKVEYRVFDFKAYPKSFSLKSSPSVGSTTAGEGADMYAELHGPGSLDSDSNPRWKPAVMVEALATTKAPVVWLDAGDMVKAPLADIVEVFGGTETAPGSTLRGGVLARSVSDSQIAGGAGDASNMDVWVHPGTINFFRKSPQGSVFRRGKASPLPHSSWLFGRPNLLADTFVMDGRDEHVLQTIAAPWLACAYVDECWSPQGAVDGGNHLPAQASLSLLVHWQWPHFADVDAPATVPEAAAGRGLQSAPGVPSEWADSETLYCAEGVQEANAAFDDAFVVLQQRHSAGVFSAAGSREPGMHRTTCKAAQAVHVRVKHAKSQHSHQAGAESEGSAAPGEDDRDDDNGAASGAQT